MNDIHTASEASKAGSLGQQTSVVLHSRIRNLQALLRQILESQRRKTSSSGLKMRLYRRARFEILYALCHYKESIRPKTSSTIVA
jgi:hypothetical protein